MSCPLCHSNKMIVLNRTPIFDLKKSWNSKFGFDPFPHEFANIHIEKNRCESCQLEYFEPEIFGDADFYARLSKNPWYYEQSKWEYDVAADIVARLRPETLLEIGCGNGHFIEKISSLGVNIEGVDINQNAVSVCKSKGLKVDNVNVFDIQKSFDIVVLFEVLEHMEDAKGLFDLLVTNLIKPKGFLIIAVPNPDGYLREIDVNLLDMPPHHNSCWGLKCFEELSARYGLTLVEYMKEPLRYVHYQGYLQSLISSHAQIANSSFHVRWFYKIQSLLIRLLAPMNYLRDRDRIDGQTHLVVLRNDRTYKNDE